jgi:hypothetical protein
LFDEEFSLGGRTIGADAIFDGDNTAFVFAKGHINEAVIFGNVAVDDGEIFFLDEAIFEGFSEFAGGSGIFRDQNNAAGFAVEAIDKIRFEVRGFRLRGKKQTATADETGHFAIFGGMANKACGFVDHEQIGVFKNDIEHAVF